MVGVSRIANVKYSDSFIFASQDCTAKVALEVA